MPYLETAQSWLTQSTLLLQARPSTTRITTKYNISPLEPTKAPRPRKQKPNSTTTPAATTPLAPIEPPPRATLTLKTYDSTSGTTLKYSTTKAAEVSRLIQILGRLARPMAGLPEMKEMEGILSSGAVEGAGGEGSPAGTPKGEGVPGVAPAAVAGKKEEGHGHGDGKGGKGKKKKGKK